MAVITAHRERLFGQLNRRDAEDVAAVTTLSIARRIELFKAVEAGDVATVESLFQQARVRRGSQRKSTLASKWIDAALAAIGINNMEMLELLLNTSVSLFSDAKQQVNLDPLVAFTRGRSLASGTSLLHLIQAQGRNVNSSTAINGFNQCQTPACVDNFVTEGAFTVGTVLDRVRRMDVARRLLELGVDVRSDTTALHNAADAVLDEVVAVWLSEEFADVDGRDFEGRTALMRLVSYDRSRSSAPVETRLVVAQLLLDTGADLSAKDNAGKTALHYSAGGNFLALLETLLERGANPNEVDNNGEPVLDCVRRPLGRGVSNMENLELLLRYGADPNTSITSAAADRVPFVDRLMQLVEGRAFVATHPQHFTT